MEAKLNGEVRRLTVADEEQQQHQKVRRMRGDAAARARDTCLRVVSAKAISHRTRNNKFANRATIAQRPYARCSLEPDRAAFPAFAETVHFQEQCKNRSHQVRKTGARNVSSTFSMYFGFRSPFLYIRVPACLGIVPEK
jgi:hypothetical protein